MLEFWLSEFKWYRKKKGGIWYKVSKTAHGSGWTDQTVEYWVREVKEGETIIKTEKY